MTCLAALTAEHNATENEEKAKQQRDDVAEAREDRRRIRRGRKDGVDKAGGVPAELLHYIAAAVDDGADPSRRCAEDGHPLLGGAQARLGEELRRAPAAQPRAPRGIRDARRAA